MKIYHNDIKPANIMLDSDNSLYLIDVDSIKNEIIDSCAITLSFSPCIKLIKVY
jgi:serine/threonine protein kinase